MRIITGHNASAINKLSYAIFASFVSLLSSMSVLALEEVADDELAKVTGRELMSFTTINPGEMGNPNGDVGFYRFRLDGKIEINANINKLRLGCDNANGNGPCDISIDKVGLSGIVPNLNSGNGNVANYPYVDNNNGTGNQSTVEKKLAITKGVTTGYNNPSNVAPATDFVMDKPFIELAIKNPGSLVNREVVGYRFGAEENWGVMSTGAAPAKGADNNPIIPIYGPVSYGSTQLKNYGTGDQALQDLWAVMKAGTGAGTAQRQARFTEMNNYVNASVERGHTGVNYISGRLPIRLDNLNVEATVFDPVNLGTLELIGHTTAKTAIVAGNLDRKRNIDFGAYQGEDVAGYTRNTFLGDSDTLYDTATYGQYVGNVAAGLQGRAQELKRAQRANINGMIVHVHDTLLNIGAGDKYNNQDIAAKTFHQLQYGQDLNGNGRYDQGEGAKHQAFSYQTLDGLQWITTDKRFGDEYDTLGNVVAGTEKTVNGGGYDWLSTRAGWWLESPMALVSGAYVPLGQATTLGVPSGTTPIQLQSLDLGARPLDNCYGSLNFC